MKTKHTPGPWEIEIRDNESNKDQVSICSNDGETLAYINKYEDSVLIAAAPEMLEALENALRLLAVAENNNAFKDCALPLIGKKTIEQIESIINKAKGE